MNENKIQYELHIGGPRSKRATWEPDWLDSTPTERRQTEETPVVTTDSRLPGTANDDYSDWCWTQVSAADYRYLTQPRNYPSPCPWCGGRLVHNPLCNELRRSWQPTLPFGKHKGKTLPEVPRNYLEWFVTIAGSELRALIQHHLADVPR